jgi:hypothetical protein
MRWGTHLGQRGGGRSPVSLRGGNDDRPVGRRCRWGRSEGEGGAGAVDEVSNGRAMLFDARSRRFRGRLQLAPREAASNVEEDGAWLTLGTAQGGGSVAQGQLLWRLLRRAVAACR